MSDKNKKVAEDVYYVEPIKHDVRDAINEIREEFRGLMNVTESCSKRMNKLFETAEARAKLLTSRYKSLIANVDNMRNTIKAKESSISDLISQVAILEKQRVLGVKAIEKIGVLEAKMAYLSARISYLKNHGEDAETKVYER